LERGARIAGVIEVVALLQQRLSARPRLMHAGRRLGAAGVRHVVRARGPRRRERQRAGHRQPAADAKRASLHAASLDQAICWRAIVVILKGPIRPEGDMTRSWSPRALLIGLTSLAAVAGASCGHCPEHS